MRVTVNNRTAYFGTGSGTADDAAPSVVFVHGAGFDHSVWVMPARFFARHGYRVMAVDLPGHGRSDGPALGTIEEMSAWLGDFLNTQVNAGAPCIMIGHSMGSLVVAHLAERAPEQIHGLVLLGTAIPMAVGPPLLNAARDNHRAAYDMANTWSHSARDRIGSGSVPGMSNFLSDQRWLERNGEDVYFADLNACNEFAGLQAALTQPLLIIAGSEDKMTPAKLGHDIAAAHAAARTVTLEGSGHAMLSEQPNQVLDALAEFVFSVAPMAKSGQDAR